MITIYLVIELVFLFFIIFNKDELSKGVFNFGTKNNITYLLYLQFRINTNQYIINLSTTFNVLFDKYLNLLIM